MTISDMNESREPVHISEAVADVLEMLLARETTTSETEE